MRYLGSWINHIRIWRWKLLRPFDWTDLHVHIWFTGCDMLTGSTGAGSEEAACSCASSEHITARFILLLCPTSSSNYPHTSLTTEKFPSKLLDLVVNIMGSSKTRKASAITTSATRGGRANSQNDEDPAHIQDAGHRKKVQNRSANIPQVLCEA